VTAAPDRPAERGGRYAGAAIALFVVLGLDVLSLFVGKLLDGRGLGEPGVWPNHWYATVGMFLCSVTMWIVAAALVVRWARRRGRLDALVGTRWDRGVLLAVLVGVVLLLALAYLESAGSLSLSLIREYRGFEHRYPGRGALVTAFQYLYYLLESLMVVLLMAMWQRAGEIWTGRVWVPWGGVGLALTWGVAHFATHPAGAVFVVPTALVYGGVFVGARKSVVPTLAAVYFSFIV